MNRTLIAVFIALSAAACGRSPLLHHDNERTPAPNGPVSQTVSDNCLLSWQPSQGRLCAKVQWLLPPLVGENRIRIIFDGPLNGATVAASADMPDMGHGTAPISVTTLDDQTVELSDVWLIMNGRWVIRITVGGQESQWSVEL